MGERKAFFAQRNEMRFSIGDPVSPKGTWDVV